MKKYLLIASAALLALAACSKVTPVEQPASEISFSVVNYAQRTKADAQGVKFENNDFGTYAWWSPDTWEVNKFNTAFMSNVQITKSNNAWKPAQPYYWTKTGSISFFSYSPYKAQGAPEYRPATAQTDDAAATAEGWYLDNYTIPDGAREDLMFADPALNHSKNVNTVTDNGAYNDGTQATDDSGYEGVPTLFHHALTKVAFQFNKKHFVKAEVDEEDNVTNAAAITWPANVTSFDIQVTSAKVYAAKTASYAVDKWTGYHNDAGEYDYTPTNAPNLAEADQVTAAPNFFYLLPQPMTTTISKTIGGENGKSVTTPSLVLTYKISITYKGATERVVETVTDAIYPLSLAVQNNSAIDWTPNKSILYTITINPFFDEQITFDPAVVDWNETANGTITVEDQQ